MFIFNKLFKLIKQYYPNITHYIRPKITYNNTIPLDFLLSHYKDGFAFPQITKYIKSAKKYIIIKYNNINLHIIYKKNNEINITKLYKSIYRAYTLAKINNITTILNIYIIMSPYKRYLPKTGIIKPIHINGGFTYLNSTNIFISRKEEYSKVILHEIIHHINNINNNNWSNKNIIDLKTYFKISNKTILNPNEAIIELWASIYNILFIAYEYKLNYKIILKKEIENSLNQSYKLVCFQNNKLWHEYTNAYCYIVFKTILLYHLKKLMKIYTYPYDTDRITNFLIENAKLPKIIKNTTKYRNNNSLCMMLFSDY